MLKRLVIIAFITGLGQISAIFIIKWVAQRTTTAELAPLAQIDSLFQLLINIIALGLQSHAMRNIALQDEWQMEYAHAQSARITMGIFLLPIGLFAFFNPAYIIFLMAPVLALSGDYAQYARGYSIQGAVVSLIRVLIPYLLVLLAGFYMQQSIGRFYFAGLLGAYFVTNLYINAQLKIRNFYPPRWKDFLAYFKTLHLGLVNLSFYIIGLGMLLIIPYFFPLSVIPVAFVGLKLHMIFKWVLRMIHQSFLKDMKSDKVCLKVDQLCSLIGLVFASSIIIFPVSFITLFIGKQHVQSVLFFTLLALSALVYSLFSSITTKSLLERKDKRYATIATTCSGVALLSPVIFSFITKNSYAISASLLISETLFSLLMVFFVSNKMYIRERIIFYSKNLAFLLIPLIIRIGFADHVITFIISTILISLALGMSYYKRFLTIH